MKILAGIVTFHPELERLKANINAILPQVDHLVLVDNGSENLAEIQSLVQDGMTLIPLGSNLGIAKALNEIGQYAIDQSFDWFLTLDQDTVVNANLMDLYRPYLGRENTGMLTCLFQDINKDAEEIPEEEVTLVERAITSATLMNTEIFRASHRFDEVMFIDLVDYDICIQYLLSGYDILRVNQVGFLHEIGNAQKIKFFGRDVFTYNHSPFRKYYIARNAHYLIRKYGKNKYTRHYSSMVRAEFLKILFYEKQKGKKLGAIIRGVLAGKRMNVKKYEK
ncbi:glycosyltransferase family 2 protein [Streptococcus sp. DD13]|uniref:glycosyltransferase family 2 protein n=1 Tax=Streptococcus sp. DD13 TaxID=1777881 RepID=UPI000791ACA1|nr:glycosyltransferase family 2 protein [Streptococcus sp. DD13]KXT79152.1 dTDP-rhamnosyl transferase RfbF [Streptococcus sp. DD13]